MKDFSTKFAPDDPDTAIDVEKTVSSLIDPDSGNELPAPVELRSQFKIADGDRFEDYGDLKLLGLGGMGAVFQADDPALERKVALKILRSNYRNRASSVEKFIREARITARIDHPNIISVHRLGVLENIGVYFTMKRINGETLREILNRIAAGREDYIKKYPIRRLLEIFIAGCNGIAAAHDHGYIHCDLKPGNLMIGKFGEVLVLDWGVAREKMPQGPIKTEAHPVQQINPPVEGTPVFMAPELLCNEVAFPDEQTDIYGLGAILYAIITGGKFPFDISQGNDILIRKIVNGEIIPLSHHLKHSKPSHELIAICEKAMARNRLERYSSVMAMLEDIHNHLDGYPVSACSPNIFNRFFKMIKRHPLIPAVVLALGISWMLYYGYHQLMYQVERKAIMTIIQDNHNQGNRNRILALRRFERYRKEQLSPEEKEQLRNYMYVAAVNASIEYNLIFDAASKLRYRNRHRFLQNGGTRCFSEILRMHWKLGNRDMLKEFLNRCRSQWRELFNHACKIDSDLKQLVERIQFNLNSDNSVKSTL